MGCHSGTCGPRVVASPQVPGTGDTDAELAAALITQGRKALTADSPCCAHCAGVVLDSTEPPVAAGEVLRRGRACPLSIMAYHGAIASRKGGRVEVEPRAGCPALIVDGVEVDPFDEYRSGHCGGGCEL